MTNPTDERAPRPEHLRAGDCPPDPQPYLLAQNPGNPSREQSHQHHAPEPQAGEAPASHDQPGLAEQTRGTAEQARKAVTETAQQVKGQANEAMRGAMTQGREMLHAQKGRVASEIRTFSEAARRAADRLEQESDTNLARYVASAADRIERLGRRIEEGDPRELLDDVRGMARRRPEVFFGGLFVAGLAAARFLKSTRPDSLPRPSGRDAATMARNSGEFTYPPPPEMHPAVPPPPTVSRPPAPLEPPLTTASAPIDPDLPGYPSTLESTR